MTAVADLPPLNITPAAQYVLRLGDTCLVHAQRLSEWCGHAPVLEEDIALTNMALDLVGQARALLTLAGTMAVAAGHAAWSEDQLAYLRRENQYFNLSLVEQPLRRSSAHAPGGDFADTVLRNFFVATWLKQVWQGVIAAHQGPGPGTHGAGLALAGVAGKAVKEVRYQQQHNADWVVRLGDGSAESARRMAAALQRAWPFVAEMFLHDAVDETAAATGLGPERRSLQAAWQAEVQTVLAAACLALPAATPFASTGTLGRHTEHLGFMLAEMQSLQRQFPGGRW
jgi:ring-1,2-phenylacetyl-CoA epoxidase subunit PaaC